MPTMEISREDLNPCTVQLSVTCAPEQVKTGFDKAYKAYAKRMRVPGFRPGHAPKSVLEPLIDKNELYNVAAEEIVRVAMTDALKQHEIRPHDQPVVDVKELNEEDGKCTFVAKVPLEPQVTLGEYKGLKIEGEKSEVTDKEVESFLDELRNRKGSQENVTNRGVQDGDMVVVNIKADGEEGPGKTFMSAAGQLFKGLDEAIHGMKAEEMKHCELSFPKDFSNKDWAGKKKKVMVTVKSVSTLSAPELDDAFAQEGVGEGLKSKDLKELKGKVKERLTEMRAGMAEEMVNERIQEALMSSSTVHVPDTMWEAVANQRLREIAQEVGQKGQTMEDYAKDNGMTVEEMVKSWQDEAKVQVQRAVIANTIFKQEKMRLTNDDFTQTVVAMARDYNTHPQTLFDALKKNKMLYEVEVRAVYNKVMTFLRENATIS